MPFRCARYDIALHLWVAIADYFDRAHSRELPLDARDNPTTRIEGALGQRALHAGKQLYTRLPVYTSCKRRKICKFDVARDTYNVCNCCRWDIELCARVRAHHHYVNVVVVSRPL